jgi:hypothetical protein
MVEVSLIEVTNRFSFQSLFHNSSALRGAEFLLIESPSFHLLRENLYRQVAVCRSHKSLNLASGIYLCKPDYAPYGHPPLFLTTAKC